MSDQKALKVSIHSFPAWRSAFKRLSVEIDRQVRLLCPWARYLTGLPLYLWMIRLVVTGGNLTRRPKSSLCCLLVEVAWQINEYLNLNQQVKHVLFRNRLQCLLFLVSIAWTTSMNMSVEVICCIFFAYQIKMGYPCFLDTFQIKIHFMVFAVAPLTNHPQCF